MKVVHVLRKPLSGTVASNTLKHGCGGLNIDASRISTQDSLDGGAYAKNPAPRGGGYDLWTSQRKGDSQAMRRGFADYEQPTGRWPGNLILQHLPGCRCEGTRKVKGDKRGATGGKKECGLEGKGKDIYSAGWRGSTEVAGAAYGDIEGNESVANWICEPGCPVKALDAQSGECPSWGVTHQPKRSGYSYRSDDDGGAHVYRPPDTGGASRYFKQVGGEDE